MDTKRSVEIASADRLFYDELKGVVDSEIETATALDGQNLLTFLACCATMNLGKPEFWRRCKSCRGRLMRLTTPVSDSSRLKRPASIVGRDYPSKHYQDPKVWVCSRCGDVHVKAKLWSGYSGY